MRQITAQFSKEYLICEVLFIKQKGPESRAFSEEEILKEYHRLL